MATAHKLLGRPKMKVEMPKITKSSKRAGKLTIEEFYAKHPAEVQEVFQLLCPLPKGAEELHSLAAVLSAPPWAPLPAAMNGLKSTSFFRLLSDAGRRNCPEAFYYLLFFWLLRMRVKIPDGVLLAPGRPPGRPQSTDRVYSAWVLIGRPPLKDKNLAVAIYGEQFAKASAADRKRLIDRCRKAVSRRLLPLGQNLAT